MVTELHLSVSDFSNAEAMETALDKELDSNFAGPLDDAARSVELRARALCSQAVGLAKAFRFAGSGTVHLHELLEPETACVIVQSEEKSTAQNLDPLAFVEVQAARAAASKVGARKIVAPAPQAALPQPPPSPSTAAAGPRSPPLADAPSKRPKR
jgi:hypothetical protein